MDTGDGWSRLTNQTGAAKHRDKWVWSRIEPQKFGAGTRRARFCQTRPNAVNQVHFFRIVQCRHCQAPDHCMLSAFESTLGGREPRSASHAMSKWRRQASPHSRPPPAGYDDTATTTITTRARTRTGTKHCGPSEIDAYLLWISGLTLWDEGPFRLVQQCFVR